ncbi:hypothetical protein [Alkalihalobacillus sp. 1P02AB]|uniref:hypothetical protein n=1 Tax=Alkalihalobacillus sp. 1P02AB TaxID=3132260 RepID=UPI0039A6F89A
MPTDYIIWTFNYPASIFVLIYELYLFFIMFYFLQKRFRKKKGIKQVNSKDNFFKRNKKSIYALFVASNIVLFYIIVSAVTVVTNNKIIDYSFLYPQGREYSHAAVVKVSTGVYGKNSYIPFKHSKGQFFYIIELADGKKIDLTEAGGVQNNQHEYFIIEELDREFVNSDIPKVSSIKHFEYTTEHLDEIYTEKIRNILENTN